MKIVELTSTEVYKTLKGMKKKKINVIIKSKKGQLLAETKKIMKRWKPYFQELLKEGTCGDY